MKLTKDVSGQKAVTADDKCVKCGKTEDLWKDTFEGKVVWICRECLRL